MTLKARQDVITSALVTLVVLQTVMLGALYAGVSPHPPATTPLFAIAPFLAMAISAALASLILGFETLLGRGLGIVAGLAAAISFGPQKYLDAQFALIWPAVVTGQVAILAVFAMVFKGLDHATE